MKLFVNIEKMKNSFKNILITAPTQAELQGLIDMSSEENGLWKWNGTNHKITLFISGIASPLTMFSLMNLLENQSFDLIIQIGIAGSFSTDLPPGSLALVKEDVFADILIDDCGTPKSLSEMGFSDYENSPFEKGFLKPEIPLFFSEPLPQLRSITVNIVSGSDALAELRRDMYKPDLESMEGAAFFYVAMMKNISCIQVRAVSNSVGDRNTKNWDIPLALENLYSFLKRELLP